MSEIRYWRGLHGVEVDPKLLRLKLPELLRHAELGRDELLQLGAIFYARRMARLSERRDKGA